MTTVREAMSRELVTVRATATVGAAVDDTLRRGHTHLVVVDDAGTLVDILSTHLLVTAMMTRLVDRQQPLADVLAEPVTVRSGAELADAATLMMERSVEALGVLDRRGALVGLLTWADVGRSALGLAATGKNGGDRRDVRP